ALDLLFPQLCIFCDGDRKGGGDFLCLSCREDIAWLEPPFCHSCGMPAEIDYDYPTPEFECSLCRREPFRFDRARSLGYYQSVLKQLIHHFKYAKQPGVMKEITQLIERFFGQSTEDWSGLYVSHVPLHFRKMRERGFDQSFLVAKQVAATLGEPMAAGLLRRVVETPPQAKMSRGDRKKNVSGAFEVNRPDQVEGKKILLVDDVFTTGSTVSEASKALKRAGAKEVFVFTLARA
ncbi:MAG: ComF family protein, partial [Nitrospinae bacterium]|nr:ComF family protein [Nitrospinota bacterium]